MKRLLLAILLLNSLVFAKNPCPQVSQKSVQKMVKTISNQLGDKTIEGFIKLGEFGAKTACHSAYQLGCNASLDAETAAIGGASICVGTGATIIRTACKTAVTLASKELQKHNQDKEKKAKKAVANYFYSHSKKLAKKITIAVNKELKKDCDRLHNNRKLTVINKTSHNVLFSVDIKGAPDSQSKEKEHHTGVVGHLPSSPKTFTVKAKVFVSPVNIKFLEVYKVNPDKQKVKVYKKNSKYHIKKIAK